MDRCSIRPPFSFVPILVAVALFAGGETLGGVALGIVPAAAAQDQPAGAPPPGGPAAGGQRGQRMGQMLMSLDLNDTQKTQIRSIVRDARKQNENVTDRDVRRANMKAAYAKIDTILNPAQRAKLHAKMDAMRQQYQNTHAQ